MEGADVSKGSMREQMPQTAAFIDALREAFGADQIDPSIRLGVAGAPGKFHAVEGGHELGTPFGVEPSRLCDPLPWWAPGTTKVLGKK